MIRASFSVVNYAKVDMQHIEISFLREFFLEKRLTEGGKKRQFCVMKLKYSKYCHARHFGNRYKMSFAHTHKSENVDVAQ